MRLLSYFAFPKRLSRLCGVFAMVVAMYPAIVCAQIEDIDVVFEEMKAIQGVWSMETDRGDRLEIWELADDSTLTGRSVRIKKESRDTVPLETMRLEWRGQDITYWASVKGQNNGKDIAFDLTEITEEGVWVFENPRHDSPVKITYWLLDNRELHVDTYGKRNGRDSKTEYIFEREFGAGNANLRIRAGANYHQFVQTGTFPIEQQPVFGARPGWEIAAQIPLGSMEKYVNFNLEVGFSGRTGAAVASFPVDTIQYERDVRYQQLWLTGALIPEIRFRPNGRFSILLGGYGARLLINSTKGTDLPGKESKIFDSNNDFRKNDFGLTAGLQYRFKTSSKSKDHLIGVRGNMGLSNLDNLYKRSCVRTRCDGEVSMRGISLYYGITLL
jgi:hypothetical protein